MAPHINFQFDSPSQELTSISNLIDNDFNGLDNDFNDIDLDLFDDFVGLNQDEQQQHEEIDNMFSTLTQIKQEPTDNTIEIPLCNTKRELHYGPVVIRPRKKPAPTLSSGRRSKNAVLTPEEDVKREIRRQRNRVAAEKCKKKREEIEKGLENTVKQLESKQNELMANLNNLNKKKAFLEKLLQQHNCYSYTRQTHNNNEYQYQEPQMYYNQQQFINIDLI